jgi:hypothetical protein
MRPPFRQIFSGTEFAQWHWTYRELRDICDYLDVSREGTIPDLRARIQAVMDGETSSASNRQLGEKAAKDDPPAQD